MEDNSSRQLLHIQRMRKRGYDAVLQAQKALHGREMHAAMPSEITLRSDTHTHEGKSNFYSDVCAIFSGFSPEQSQKTLARKSIPSELLEWTSAEQSQRLGNYQCQEMRISRRAPSAPGSFLFQPKRTVGQELQKNITDCSSVGQELVYESHLTAPESTLLKRSHLNSESASAWKHLPIREAKSSVSLKKAVQKTSLKSKELVCGQCGAIIRGKRGNLNRHINAKHLGVREFPCGMPGCGQAFQSKLNLVRHMTRVHEGRGHRCRQCPRGFRSVEALSKHEAAAHAGRTTFSCLKCGVCFGRRSVLENHVERVHGEHTPSLTVDSLPGITFKCTKSGCSRKFGAWAAVKEHEVSAHGGRVYQCPSCNTAFDSENLLSKHIRTDHGRTRASRKCVLCGCIYSQKSNLLRHIRLAHKDVLKTEGEKLGLEPEV